jgi:hypothetical protein
VRDEQFKKISPRRNPQLSTKIAGQSRRTHQPAACPGSLADVLRIFAIPTRPGLIPHKRRIGGSARRFVAYLGPQVTAFGLAGARGPHLNRSHPRSSSCLPTRARPRKRTVDSRLRCTTEDRATYVIPEGGRSALQIQRQIEAVLPRHRPLAILAQAHKAMMAEHWSAPPQSQAGQQSWSAFAPLRTPLATLVAFLRQMYGEAESVRSLPAMRRTFRKHR